MRIRVAKSLRSNPTSVQREVPTSLVRGKGKKGPEAILLQDIKKLLNVFKTQGFLTYRRIHVMPIKVNRFRDRPNTDMVGMEDLQIYLLGGRVLFWDLKSPTGKQSPGQIEREKELKSLGHTYTLIRSTEQAISELRAMGLSVWGFQQEKI